jgi:uncharacterized protein YigE (DUF2233 family)
MPQFKTNLLIFVIFFAINSTLSAQEFAPIDPQGVKLDTTSICKPGKYELIVNGPMSGDDGLPLGGYVVDGVQKKKWVNPKERMGYFTQENGIFGRTSLGQMVLVPFEEIDKFSYPFEWAFQNGKILVLDGVNMQKPGSKPARYSAIGFRPDGSLIIFLSLSQNTSTWELADYIMNYYSSCKNAILLDFDSEYSSLIGQVTENTMAPGKMKIHFRGYAYGIGKKKSKH